MHHHYHAQALRLRPRTLANAVKTAVACAALLVDPLAFARPAGPAIFTVQNCDDSGPGSLRDTIAGALSGDEVVFPNDLPCSKISLTSGAIVIANDAGGGAFGNLSIAGNAYRLPVIDGGRADRVIVDTAGTTAQLVLSNLQITNGQSDGNGGCISVQGNLALTNVDVNQCVAGAASGDAVSGTTPLRGGGIYAGGSMTITGGDIAGNTLFGNAAIAYGGGVFAGSFIGVYDATIEHNRIFSAGGAAYGGGFAAGMPSGSSFSIVTMNDSTITGNEASSNCSFCGARGGGAWIYGNSTLSGNAFTDNEAVSGYGYGTGGALYFAGSPGRPPLGNSITLSYFHGNYANNGAGIAAKGNLNVTTSTLSGNNATDSAGAIEIIGGTLSLGYSTLYDNWAMDTLYNGGLGGGIFNFGYGAVTVSNSTISGNRATKGGAIANTYGSLEIENSTIADNQATTHGDGVYFRYAYYAFDMQSTIVASNGATEDLFPPGMMVTGSNDLVMSAPGVDLPPGTISADPMLMPLADNGGPTLTQALATGSPAIDAGSNPHTLSFDQRGTGFARVYGAAADIGAYELQQPVVVADQIFTNGFDP